MSDTMFLMLVIGGVFYVVEGIIVSRLTYLLWKKVFPNSYKKIRAFNTIFSGVFWWTVYPIHYPLYKKVGL